MHSYHAPRHVHLNMHLTGSFQPQTMGHDAEPAALQRHTHAFLNEDDLAREMPRYIFLPCYVSGKLRTDGTYQQAEQWMHPKHHSQEGSKNDHPWVSSPPGSKKADDTLRFCSTHTIPGSFSRGRRTYVDV